MTQFKNKIKQFGRMVQQWCSPALFAVLAAAVIVGLLLFVPPLNGYADNGDFYRMMDAVGLYHRLGQPYRIVAYINPTYGIRQYFNENTAALFSSQPLFIRPAIWLNQLVFNRLVFDIRFQGIIYYVLFLGALYLVVRAVTRGRGLRQYVLAAVCVFVFADSSYTLYFNSLFGEAAMAVTGMAAVAALLLLARRETRPAWRRWLLLAIFRLSAGLLITVKQQNAPLALSYMVMALGLLPLLPRRKKLLAAGVLAALLITGGMTYKLITPEFQNINRYQTMTRGVLLMDKNPGKTLKEGKINPQFALLRQSVYYQSYQPVNTRGTVVQRDFVQRFDFVWVLRFYLTHLPAFGRILDLAAKDGQLTQVKAVSNYSAASGRTKQAQTHYFTGFSSFMGTFFPAKFAFYCLFVAVMMGLYAGGAYLGFRRHQAWPIMKLAVVTGLGSIIIGVMVISVVGDGDADLAKHLFMVAQSTDWLLILLLSDVTNQTLFREPETAV
ncbi:MAG TPA: hypothetical protein DCY46_09430 [Lactobacillus sp.]|nr:hypothetical protein [Lactobacillus sp.]